MCKRNGCIDEDDVTIIEIPSALKPEILSHLQVVYGIEASTVYNDLSGFIRGQEQLRDPEAEWHAGVRACRAGQHERALGFFAQYEQLVDRPRLDLRYFRAISYWYTGRRDEALAAMAEFRSRSPPYLLTAVPVASETVKTGSVGMAHCPLSQVTARGVLPPALIGARASDGDMRSDR